MYSLLSVYDKATKLWLQTPSQCGCPDGMLYCSHMIGKHLITRVVQQQVSWSFEDFQQALPEGIKQLQQLPIAIDYVYNDLAQDEKTVKEKQKELGSALAREFPNYTADDDEINDVS